MAARSVDDRRLVDLHKAGDEEAFASIVTAYHRELMSHARRRLHDPRAAEDAVQEALLRAFRALPRFNGEYKLGAWLHRIVENVCADEGNRRRREGELTDRVASLPPIPEADVADSAIADPEVTQALQSLSPSYREALVLRYVEGLPYREVAEKTGVSEENARARAHRGRAVLRRVLKGQGRGAAALIPALLAWIAAAGRKGKGRIAEVGRPISAGRPIRVVEAAATRAATRISPAATEQILAGATNFQGTGVFAKAAAVVAAITLPVASAGLGSAIGWFDQEEPAKAAGAGDRGDGAGDALNGALLDAMAAVRAGATTTQAAAAPAGAGETTTSTAPRARANVAGVEGDTERWDWFGQNPNKDPDADNGQGRDQNPEGEYIRADAMGASAEAGTTRMYGGGKYEGPDGLVAGQIEAILRTTDDETTEGAEAAGFLLTFTEEGGRSQPVRINLEGAITSMADEGDLTRYSLSGKWRLAGSGLGVERHGSFTASMVVGSTDVHDLRIVLTPEPAP